MTNRKVLALTGGVVLAILLGWSGPIRAQYSMNFNGGPMKNLYIDLIFWGSFTPTQEQSVKDYVTNLSSFLRGVNNPQGFEPAVHYYGVSNISVGTWVAGTTDLFGYGPGQAQPGLDEMSGMVQAAWAGTYGPAYDFNGTYVASALPRGSNRLPVVVSMGANLFNDYGTCQGFHDNISGYPYAAAQFESLSVLSHEIFEAMTDPSCSAPVLSLADSPGWSGGALTFDEVADQCEYDYSYNGNWTINNNTVPMPQINNIVSGVASITINQAYNYPYPFPEATCEFFIPEQNAPMSAAFEYGGNGTQPLDLYYLQSNNGPNAGHVAVVSWGNAGYPAYGPYDIGQPSPTVTAVGKPSVVYSLSSGGEYVFTRGSDAALWMHYNGSWTSLGGGIYSDPSPVVWANGTIMDVFALGLDDHLYFYGLANRNTLWGWSPAPLPSTLSFAGSPTTISRSSSSFDVFAAGENGQVDWVNFSSAGWPESQIANLPNNPMTTAPAVSVEKGTNYIDVLWTDGVNMWANVWLGSGWNGPQDGRFQLPYPEVNYGLQGTPAVVSSQSGRTDVFAVSRYGELWWWYSTTPTQFVNGTGKWAPLVGSGVTGSPIAVSRGPGEIEVFYRQNDGTLAHWTYTGSWSEETVRSVSMQ